MINYLNIYLVKKESSKDSPLLFMSFSRNHPIYRAVVKTIAPIWTGYDDGYTELTYDNLTECINSLDKETNHIVNKIIEYEKAVLKNPKSDIIEQLIEYKEIYKEMEENNHNLAFIRWFTNDIINGYSDFSKVLCNIT
jgi:Mg2+ and Co2+ transporter CorA